jgi:hypothetical protein
VAQQWHNNALYAGMVEAKLLQASILYNAQQKAYIAHQPAGHTTAFCSDCAHLLKFLAGKCRLGVNLDSSVGSTGITVALCQHGIDLSL